MPDGAKCEDPMQIEIPFVERSKWSNNSNDTGLLEAILFGFVMQGYYILNNRNASSLS